MKLLEGFCHMQCTLPEISSYFNCSVDTIERRVRETHGITFAEYFKTKRVSGLMSLRRNLFRLSEKNAAVAIFLAKNWLGMADKQETVLAGDESRPVVIKGVSAETKELIREVIRGEGTERGTADNTDIQP